MKPFPALENGWCAYLVYSTCTGAEGISLNCGMGGSVGAATSLVQQPQEEARTAVTLAAMANSRRIIVWLGIFGWFFGKGGLIAHGSKKPRPATVGSGRG